MHYVKDTNHLAELCSKLNKSKFLAIDTEFIREKTYWPKLCLIQVFNGEDKIIIDPLVKGLDLKPFFKILSNNEIVKIFHSGRQDIEIFYNLTKKIPKIILIFDMMRFRRSSMLDEEQIFRAPVFFE